MRLLYLAGWGYVAISAALIYRAGHPEQYMQTHVLGTPVGPSSLQWFDNVRSHCNPVEVQLTLSQNPPPEGLAGQGYGAACYALAGKIKQAQVLIDALPAHERTLDDPAPIVQLDGLDAGSMTFNCIAYVSSPRDVGGVKSELLFELLQRLRDAHLPLVRAQLIRTLPPLAGGEEPAADPAG